MFLQGNLWCVNASTLKSRLIYKSASYNGLTALMEVDNVTVINGQQVVLGTISDIAERVKAMPLPSPALLMMGDVIKANGYAQQLADQTLASYPVIAQAWCFCEFSLPNSLCRVGVVYVAKRLERHLRPVAIHHIEAW